MPSSIFSPKNTPNNNRQPISDHRLGFLIILAARENVAPVSFDSNQQDLFWANCVISYFCSSTHAKSFRRICPYGWRPLGNTGVNGFSQCSVEFAMNLER